MNELDKKLGLLPAPRYLIEDLFAANRVHLIGGPSGSGKTTLMYQMWDAMEKGEPFLGRQTTQVKWAYISGDRTVESVHESMRRVGVFFPVFSLVDENLVGADLIDAIIPRLTAVCGYRPDFIYIDGFTAMVPNFGMNNYGIVAMWLARLQRYCSKMGITILGACHTTKTKEGERYLNPRQKIAGSVAWAGFSESIIIIEPPDDAKDDRIRHVMLLPRNYPGEHLTLSFNDAGKLGPSAKSVQDDIATNFLMDGILEAYSPGEEINFQQIWGQAEKKGINKRTFMRWLAKYVSAGKIIKEHRGTYVIPATPQPATVQ